MMVTMLLSSINSAGNSSWSNIFPMIAQLFSILIVFAAVLFLAVYATKRMGSARFGKTTSNNLKIIESLGLGMQSGVHLVKVGKKYILLGITKDRINFLTELAEDDIVLDEKEPKAFPSFEKYLSQFSQKKQNGKDD